MSTLRNWTYGIAEFFGKLDWTSPYTYLGILGALGAPAVILGAVRRLRGFWDTTLLQYRHPAVLKDFYYRKRDFGYRVLEDGTTYLNVRRETVVSLVKGLKVAPLNYRWTGRGEIIERIEPSSVTIGDGPMVMGATGTRKIIQFEKPLVKRQETTYSVVLTCKVKDQQPTKFLNTTSSRRVDCLILRVAFPENQRPAHVTFRILDADGNEKSRAALECSDHLTGEYRKEVRYPKPFYAHRIEWD